MLRVRSAQESLHSREISYLKAAGVEGTATLGYAFVMSFSPRL